LLIVGGDCISGHDRIPARNSGAGALNPHAIGTGDWCFGTAGAGIVLACGPKDAPIYAREAWRQRHSLQRGLAWQSYVQNTEETKQGRGDR